MKRMKRTASKYIIVTVVMPVCLIFELSEILFKWLKKRKYMILVFVDKTP